MVAIPFIFAATLSACSFSDAPQAEYATISESLENSGDLPQTEPTFIIVSGEQALEMASGDIIIVDVRNRDEFDTGHVEHAILLPADEIAAQAATVLPDKNQAILLYCRSGARSSRAAAMLIEMGYTRVYDMGAFSNWQGTVIFP